MSIVFFVTLSNYFQYIKQKQIKLEVMKKITQESVENFSMNVNFHKSNTKILTDGIITSMYLFDNKIAYRIGKKLIIDNCGWKSNTTKKRKMVH